MATDEASQPSSNDTSTAAPLAPLSCTKCFDRVYYCFSPVHQLRSYYRNGTIDNCRARTRLFRKCLMSRLKSQESSELASELQEQQDYDSPSAPPVWEIRPEFAQNMAEVEEAERAAALEHSEGIADWWK